MNLNKRLTVEEKGRLFCQVYGGVSFGEILEGLPASGLGLYELYDSENDVVVTKLWLPEAAVAYYNECYSQLKLDWTFVLITTLNNEHEALVRKVNEFYANNEI